MNPTETQLPRRATRKLVEIANLAYSALRATCSLSGETARSSVLARCVRLAGAKPLGISGFGLGCRAGGGNSPVTYERATGRHRLPRMADITLVLWSANVILARPLGVGE